MVENWVAVLGAPIGMKVSIDYDTISGGIIITANCDVPVSQTYTLKEIFIINQFEIR